MTRLARQIDRVAEMHAEELKNERLLGRFCVVAGIGLTMAITAAATFIGVDWLWLLAAGIAIASVAFLTYPFRFHTEADLARMELDRDRRERDQRHGR